MIDNVILPSTTREEWPLIRQTIVGRITESFGRPGRPRPAGKAAYQELARYEKHGLLHIHLRYHVIGDEWNEGICVVPPGVSAVNPAPAVLTCHGSNGSLGKQGMLDPENLPDRAYAIELARRGYVTFSVDQYGFGPALEQAAGAEELARKFYQSHPDWSLTGRHLFGHQRALDVLEQLEIVKGPPFGVMGHSLGGYAALCLTALDERIAAGVASAGVSPNLYNVYRGITSGRLAEPQFAAAVQQKRGRMPWEKQEMIALCAPRAFLMIEPYNDPYNPYILPTCACLEKAAAVYQLLGVPERIAALIHGDGHTTIASVREQAYCWFDRFLAAKAQADSE
ncbi:MAG TPA: alpha/beta hydrolase [Firmicutes bacterium]|nr:alpha/beta hydrolase [Bacillota bacterium]